MATEKVDITILEKNLVEREAKWEAVRLSASDNFNQLLATDNYIEKYLPMKV